MGIVAGAVDFLLSEPGRILSDVRGHAVLSALAVGVAIVIAVPVGALVGHLHRWSFLAINGANVLRALPTLAIISLGIPLWGLGLVNILVALVVLAIPLILTNTYVGISEVDPGTVEAARGMGLTGWQILWRVELPNALGLIMAGVRTATVFVIATAYLAGLAAYPDTLGSVITNPTLPLAQLFTYTVITVALAFLADGVFAVVQRLLTPTGLKITRAAAA